MSLALADADRVAPTHREIYRALIVTRHRLADALQTTAASLHSIYARAACAEAVGWVEAAIEHETRMRAAELGMECGR